MNASVEEDGDESRNNSHPLGQAIVVLHDMAAAMLALPIAIMLRESQVLQGDRLVYILTCLPLLAVAALAAALMIGSYRAVWHYMGTGEIVRLAQFAVVTVLLFWLGQFLIDRLAHLPRSGPPIHFLVAMFILIGSRLANSKYRRWQENAGDGRKRRQPLLLIGTGDGTSLLIQMLALRRDTDYEPVGILADDVTRHRTVNGVSVLGRLADIDRVLAILRVQGMSPARIVVTRPHHELGRTAVQHVMKRAYAARIPVEQLPDLMRFRGEPDSSLAMVDSASGMNDLTETLGGAMTMSLYPRLKRLVDFTASAVILTSLAPLMALAAAAVAFGIHRPVLFVQIRPGRQRRPFRLLKFRTMKDPLDERGRPLSDAERTPWVGRLLRRTRLDELPQFWNVFKGDMAIIGPRPLIRADLDTMTDKGALRCHVRPGITGWAQVNGGHELRPDEKLALDLWYIENTSLALDLRIVAMTVLMMLRGEVKNDNAIVTARAALAPAPAE